MEKICLLTWVDEVNVTRNFSFVAGCESKVLGRSNDADITLNHLSVSRNHARLDRADGEIRLLDLNSSNGTFLGEAKLEPQQVVVLDGSGEFRLGHLVIWFEVHDALSNPQMMETLFLASSEQGENAHDLLQELQGFKHDLTESLQNQCDNKEQFRKLESILDEHVNHLNDTLAREFQEQKVLNAMAPALAVVTL